MSFLNWPAEEALPSRRIQRQRRRLILDLLERFGREFPEITYELLWESPLVNAQAWRFGSARYVRVYGGLARHPAITKYGLVFMLAHETGHHLGGPPRDPAMPWMTWQGQADYWAASVAMPRIYGPRARGATFRAAREIVALHRMSASELEDDEPDLSPECRYCILRSGALGQGIPSCALEAFALISDDSRGLYE